MSKIRVLLADDHTLFREGVRTLLTSEPDMEVIAEASNAGDAVSTAAESRPEVVLLDIGMPGLSSFEAARQIRRDRPGTKVVFLSMYDDEDYLAECMDVGGSGYVLKDCPAEHLTTAIREVARGGSYLSPRMLSRLVNDFRTQVRDGEGRTSRFGSLTRRERDILKLLAEGNSVKEIASNLELSVKTVEAHKFNFMRKLDLHNKAQVVQYAIQKKIIRLPPVI